MTVVAKTVKISDVRPGELLSFELGGGRIGHSCLMGQLHVVLLEDKGVLHGDILSLPDSTIGAQGALPGWHPDQPSLHLYTQSIENITEINKS